MSAPSDLSLLDPRRDRVLTPQEERRRDERLEAIIANGDTDVATAPVRPVRRRRVAAAAGVTVLVGALGAGLVATPAAAVVTWTGTPTAQGAVEALAQATACAEDWDPRLSLPAPRADDVLVSDRRGLSSVTVMRMGDSVIECVAGPLGGGWMTLTSPDGPPIDRPAADGVVTLSQGSTGSWPLTTSSLSGLVGDDVTSVTVVRDDGPDVRASLGGGFFTAWWPGDSGGRVGSVSLVIETADGTVALPSSDTFVE